MNPTFFSQNKPAGSPGGSAFDPAAWIVANATAYWGMEDGAEVTRVDVTGRGNDLADVNAVSLVAGKIGNAAFFDQTNSPGCYLSRPSTPDLQIGAGDFIFAAWVKPNESAGALPIVWKDNASTSGYGLLHAPGDGYVAFYVATSLGALNAATDPLVAEVWNLVLVRYTPGVRLQLRANHGTIAEADATGTVAVAGAGACFVGQDGTGNFFDGLIDDTIILKSDTPLSDADFAALCDYLWNGGAGRDLSALF